MEALLLLALIAAVHIGSCAAHPYRACGACGRSKKWHSTMFKGAFGACRSCAGHGQAVRFGARLLSKS